ncbi:MAG: hypothetical protein COC23_08460 [Hyphomicrobiales bacterium]|nr:MAG: hypothetical protein COC23_08460 [Hyphomicrobiales bacterium]
MNPSSGFVEHALALRTSSGTHFILPSGSPVATLSPNLNRAMKGDRVVSIRPSRFNVASATSMLLRSSSLILKSAIAGSNYGEHTMKLMAATQQFHKAIDGSVAGIAPMNSGVVRIALSKGQLDSARIAARQMANALSRKVRLAKARKTLVAAVKPAVTTTISREITGSIKPVAASSVVTAYAGSSNVDRSPFDAVLRTTLPKVRPETKRVTIVLGTDDHKWALNPLPKKTYSAAQRRCLGIGVYFESRGEPVKGQRAVAQVILNRVKNPAYPNSVCGVVYQNKHMRNRCQFSFACDRIRDRIKSKEHWAVASKVANDAIDGKVWLKTVGSASHYHADYVWPRWRRKMKRLTKIGRHIFYRTYGGGWS